MKQNHNGLKYGNIYILCGCIFCKDEKFRKKIVELSTKKDYLYNRSEIMNNLEYETLRYVGALSRAINSTSDWKYKQFDLKKGQYL